jgi:hypothetical protein
MADFREISGNTIGNNAIFVQGDFNTTGAGMFRFRSEVEAFRTWLTMPANRLFSKQNQQDGPVLRQKANFGSKGSPSTRILQLDSRSRRL